MTVVVTAFSSTELVVELLKAGRSLTLATLIDAVAEAEVTSPSVAVKVNDVEPNQFAVGLKYRVKASLVAVRTSSSATVLVRSASV